MAKSLNVLLIEDFDRGVSQLTIYLKNAGFDLNLVTVGTIEKFRSSLTSDRWNCVLAFDSVRPFGPLDAYAVLKETGYNIPLLVVAPNGDEFVTVKSIRPVADTYSPDESIKPLADALLAAETAQQHASWLFGGDLSRQIMLEIIRTSLSTPDLGDFLSKTHSSIRRLLHAGNCSVLLRDPLSGRTVFEYWVDEYKEKPESKGTVSSFADHVLLTGKPFIYNDDVRKAINGTNGAEKNGGLWTSWIGVPLRASSRTIGVLALHRYRKDSPFRERDLEFLSLVGDQVAIALERRRAEIALRESEGRYRMLFDHAPDGIIISDPAGRLLDINSSFCRILDYSRSELLALEPSEIAAVEEVGEVSRALEEISQTSKHNREWKLRRRDGSTVCVDIGSKLMPDGNILAVIRDITERKRAEKERAELAAEVEGQRERLNNIVAHVPGIVWKTGFPGVSETRLVNFVSAYVTEILGYSPDECLAMPNFPLAIVHPDFQSKVASSMDGLASGGKSTMEFPLIAKNGDAIWVEAQSAAVTGPTGTVIGIRGVMIDITDRKRSEQALRRSEERYRDLVENAIDMIYVHDLQGNYTAVNAAAERITGYTRSELLTMNMAQLLFPESLKRMKEILSGKTHSISQVEVAAKDGTRIAMEVNVRPVYLNNEPVAFQGIARDVTERKLLEEKYRQSQKMEAVGLLAGGISHDFNNLLTAITGYSEITLARMSVDDPLRQNIEEIKETGERASALTQQLLAFSRKQVLEPVIHNLNTVIRNMERMLRRLVREDIEFLIDLDDDLGNIEADPGQLEQVIMNLVINAQDAMPRGGRLTIRTENVTDANNPDITTVGGPFVRMTVSDTGEGIDEQIQGRIFEPFFTTKEAGKGSGLGLSTVHGIVSQSGGEIFVHSSKGKGTAFEIFIPAVGPASDTPAWSEQQAERYTGSETVLLVEDDPGVRKLVREVLTQKGYEVLEASCGESALKICGSTPQPIQMLLTDLVMPKMSGIELTEEVLKMHPETKSLVMSGYTGITPLGDLTSDFKATFIQKPFSPEDLAKKVREVLEA